jgi:hypothetical protein
MLASSFRRSACAGDDSATAHKAEKMQRRRKMKFMVRRA